MLCSSSVTNRKSVSFNRFLYSWRRRPHAKTARALSRAACTEVCRVAATYRRAVTSHPRPRGTLAVLFINSTSSEGSLSSTEGRSSQAVCANRSACAPAFRRYRVGGMPFRRSRAVRQLASKSSDLGGCADCAVECCEGATKRSRALQALTTWSELSFPRLRGDVSRCRDCVVCVAVSQDGRDTTHHMVSTKCASCASQTWCRVS